MNVHTWFIDGRMCIYVLDASAVSCDPIEFRRTKHVCLTVLFECVTVLD